MSRSLPLLFALFCALSLAKSAPLQVEYQQWENDYNCCDENVHNGIITTVIDKIAVRFHGTLKLKIWTQAYQDRPDQGNMLSLNAEDEAGGFPCSRALGAPLIERSYSLSRHGIYPYFARLIKRATLGDIGNSLGNRVRPRCKMILITVFKYPSEKGQQGINVQVWKAILLKRKSKILPRTGE